MARVIVVVNEVRELRAAQTTASLAAAFCARGHEVFVVGVGALGLDTAGATTARACRVDATDTTALVAALATAPQERICIGAGDLVLLRTNPGRDPRDWAHRVMLELARGARDAGAVVLNDPDGLARASSKLFLRELPVETRPATLISRDAVELRSFVAGCAGGAVLKPLDGTQGRDVFRLRAGDTTNLNQIVDLLTRGGFAMAQAFVPEAMEGDVRVLMVDGLPLQSGGRTAAVRRVPGTEDFRSNVHVGGTASPAEWSPGLAAVAEAVGPVLRRAGLFFCGLDVIGDKVVEVNVFSPGGLQDAALFGGVDFVGALVDRMEARLGG
jgi:glutathione synthase